MARIIQNKVRKIGLKYSSLSGRFYSVKNNSEVLFESSLERDMIIMLEMDNLVHSYHEQPIKISFIGKNGQSHTYTPDFLIFFHYSHSSLCKKPTLVEVKYRDDLKQKFADYKEKFKAAIDFCKLNGYDFKIMTEDNIRGQFFENAKFLYRYKKSESLHLGNSDVELLIKIMCEVQMTTPKDLILLAAQDKKKQQELIYVLWYLVSRYIIRCNLESKITMSSQIWLDDLFINRY